MSNVQAMTMMRLAVVLLAGAVIVPTPSNALINILEDVFSDDPDNPDTEDGEENDDDLFSEIAKGVGEFVGEFVEGAESLGAELTEAQQNLQEALTGITGQDVFDAAGNAVGFVAETGVYFSNVTGLDGQTIYDAGKNVVGTIAKAAKDGVDEQDLTMGESFKLISDGAEIIAGAVSIGMDATAALTKGGTCTVACAVAEHDSQERGLEHDLAACLAACGLEFADDAGEVTANLLDGVATMLSNNVCGSVDIVADILGATTANLGAEAGDAVADAIAESDAAIEAGIDGDAAGNTLTELSAAGADLFSDVLKGSCDVLECAGAVMPELANAARDFDPSEVVEAIDVAIAQAGGSECASAFAEVGNKLHASCLAGRCDECASSIATVDVASVVDLCAPGADAIAASAASVLQCMDDLTELDEQAAALLMQAVTIADAETFTIQAELNARVTAAEEACGIHDDVDESKLTPAQRIDAVMAVLDDSEVGIQAKSVLLAFLEGQSAEVTELPIDELLALEDVQEVLETVLDADQLDAVVNSAQSFGEADEDDDNAAVTQVVCVANTAVVIAMALF